MSQLFESTWVILKQKVNSLFRRHLNLVFIFFSMYFALIPLMYEIYMMPGNVHRFCCMLSLAAMIICVFFTIASDFNEKMASVLMVLFYVFLISMLIMLSVEFVVAFSLFKIHKPIRAFISVCFFIAAVITM